jgi:hypothetical protein
MKRDLTLLRPVAAIGLAAAVMLLASPDALAQGCAMCKTSIGGAEDPLAKAFTASSIFMICMPLATIVTIASWITLSIRRGRLQPMAVSEFNNESNMSEKGIES